MRRYLLVGLLALSSVLSFGQNNAAKFAFDWWANDLVAQPSGQASAVTVSDITATTVTFNWTNGNGTSRVVLIKSGSAVNSDPVDGTSYSADAAFGSGSQIGSGNYVVRVGSGPVTVTGLTNSTDYYIAVYEFSGTAGTENYLTPGATANFDNWILTTGVWRDAGVWIDSKTWID